MGKLVRRFLLGDLSNIQEYEEYFSDMSREGLHLEKIGRIFVYFKEGQSKNLKYRIDLAKEKEIEAKKEEHREKGWDFVADKDSFLIFSTEEASNLNELYSTPEEQKIALMDAQEEKIKKDFNNLGWQGLSIIIIATFLYFSAKTAGGLYLFLAEDNELYSFIFIMLIPFLNYGRERKNLKRIENTLDSGEFLKHEGDYLKMNIKFIIKRFVIIVFILIGILIIYNQLTNSEIRDIDSKDNLKNTSIVTIKDIENYNKDEIKSDGEKLLFKNSSLFTPKNYLFIENLKLKDKDENYKNLDTNLEVNYYLNRFKFISKGLEGDILNREKKKYNINFKEVQGKRDMSIHSFEKENTIYLLIRRDEEVIFLEYENGISSLERIIEAIDKKIQGR